MLLTLPVGDVIVVDSTGALAPGREGQNDHKERLALITNKDKKQGSLAEIIKDADAIIGVSGPGTITPEMVKSMAKDPIVFAMANPTPEIMPELAHEAGAAVVASGRSDFPNQINNVLAFPGIFQAVIKGRLKKITPEMKVRAASALAAQVPTPTAEYIIPDVFHPGLAETVAEAVLSAA
jgi:malate dehydrogenase (oxaloacetate-decarboxylating)